MGLIHQGEIITAIDNRIGWRSPAIRHWLHDIEVRSELIDIGDAILQIANRNNAMEAVATGDHMGAGDVNESHGPICAIVGAAVQNPIRADSALARQ